MLGVYDSGDGSELVENNYDDIQDKKFSIEADSGYFGITDRMWVSVILPQKNKRFKSVHDFNYLLLDICTQYGCIFMDCFKMFLDREGNGLNRDLYRDRIHINDHGLILLCRAIKFVIYNNVFNPYMRISHNDYYYYT